MRTGNFPVIFWGFIFSLLVFAGADLSAQSRLDSLREELRTLPDDTPKVWVLAELSQRLEDSAPGDAEMYQRQALRLSQAREFHRGVLSSLNELAGLSMRKGDTVSAGKYLSEAENYPTLSDFPYWEAMTTLQQGKLATMRAEYAHAMSQLKTALILWETLDLPSEQGQTHGSIGAVYMELGEFPRALEHYLDALRYLEPYPENRALGTAYVRVGQIYQRQKLFRESLDYLKKGLENAKALKNLPVAGDALEMISAVHREQNKPQKALKAIEQALEIRRQTGNKKSISQSLNMMAAIYEEIGKSDEALHYHNMALGLATEINDQKGMAATLNCIGMVHTKEKDYQSALVSLFHSQDIARELENREIMEQNYLLLSQVYAGMDDHQQALSYLQRYTRVHDSLYAEENREMLSELQAKYETERKEQEIEVLNLEQEKSKLELSASQGRLLTLGGILVLVVGVAGSLFFAYYNKNRANQELLQLNEELAFQSKEIARKNQEIESQRDQLESQNRKIREINTELETIVGERTADLKNALSQVTKSRDELDTFVYRASHDLRGPIVRMQGLTQVARLGEPDQETLRYIDLLAFSATNLERVLRKLIQVRQIANKEPEFDRVDIYELAQELSGGLQKLMPEGMQEPEIEVDENLDLVTDPELLRIMLANLLENSVIFRAEGNLTPIVLKFNHKGDNVTITVEDQGEGVDASIREQIFEMFFRGSLKSRGNGLGLHLVQGVAEKLNGSVQLESETGKFTRFTVQFPNGQIPS